MRNSVRQILLSGALLLGATTALGAATPVFCGFERFRGQSESHYETSAEGAVYFDGEILFEGSSSRPDRGDDRIVVWYRRGSASAAGELVVTAGFIDPNGLITARDYAVAAELEDGTYHRVTIRAVDNVLDETQALPGFVVFLDGERLACDVAQAYAAEPSRFPLGWAVRERYVDGATRAVFPSLGVKKVGAAAAGVAKIVRAGLQGAGGARNCVLTDAVSCDETELPKANFRAGDEYFIDFEDAMSALSEKATDAAHPVVLRLLEDFTPEGGTLEIPAGTFVTLDLAGRRLEGAICACGTLEVVDTVGGGSVAGSEEEGCALWLDGGAVTIRAGRWLDCVIADEGLEIVAGEFFDDGLREGVSDGGFYLAEHGEGGYAYFAKGSYVARIDVESRFASVAAADGAKVTVTFVYGATTWATSQYTANGDDWNYAVGEPTATGYSFVGWRRLDGTEWTHDYSVKADQYVVAAFTNNRYVVTFLDATNGTWATRSYVYAVDEFELPAEPSNPGWDFAGWCRSNPGDWSFDCMTAADVTVKPTWEKHYEVIEFPRAVVGLCYDGTLKTGVVEGVGYTLKGNTGTELGAHTATATLAKDYKWSDGTRNAKSVVWKIYTPAFGAEAKRLDGAVSGETRVAADTSAEYADRKLKLTSAAGDETATIEIKPYYDAKFSNGTLTLTMNEKAEPKFAADGGDDSPVGVSEDAFTVRLANVHPGFSYRLGVKADLSEKDWNFRDDWRRAGDVTTLQLSAERGQADAVGFYVIEYKDGE